METPNIPGADELVAWFGQWPSFHDAEVTNLNLNRAGSSTITIHCFRMTSEVDERGSYCFTHDALVTFAFAEVTGCELFDFNHQNVISTLIVETEGIFSKLILGGCYGLQGSLSGKALTISFLPGKPSDGVYSA